MGVSSTALLVMMALAVCTNAQPCSGHGSKLPDNSCLVRDRSHTLSHPLQLYSFTGMPNIATPLLLPSTNCSAFPTVQYWLGRHELCAESASRRPRCVGPTFSLQISPSRRLNIFYLVPPITGLLHSCFGVPTATSGLLLKCGGANTWGTFDCMRSQGRSQPACLSNGLSHGPPRIPCA